MKIGLGFSSSSTERSAGRARRILATIAIGIFLSLISSTFAAAAAGTPDCTSYFPPDKNHVNGHCYSMLIGTNAWGIQNSNWRGVHGATQLSYMVTGGADAAHPYHINSTVFAQQGTNNHYIEAGVSNGFVRKPGYSPACSATDCVYWIYDSGNGGSPTCYASGCGSYTAYWADHTVDSSGRSVEYHHIIRFLSPSPSATEYMDIFAEAGHWTINFSGAFNYHGVSTLLDSYTKINGYEIGGEYYGPAQNGQCNSPGTPMTLGFWDQNMGYHPGNTQNGPKAIVDPGFTIATGTSGFLSWALTSC